MNITIKDLLNIVKWKDVKRSLKYHYPTDKNNYEKLFYELGKRKKVTVEKGDFLEVYALWDIDDPENEEYTKKYLQEVKNGEEFNYYGIHLLSLHSGVEKYSVMFIPWSKMISYPIHPKTLYHLTFIDIVAHFLWEITYFGNEKKMKKQGEKLYKISKKIEKDIKKKKI
jgi:hypothetical protein